MNRAFAIRAAVLLFSSFSLARSAPKLAETPLPCAFKGELLQVGGTNKWFTSDEMKQRTTHRVDVGALLKNADVNGTVIVSVIVGSDGSVECLSVINPKHPLIVSEVDKAVRQWTFKPMQHNGKSVPYVGLLVFQFCRIGCAEGKSSVTLLE